MARAYPIQDMSDALAEPQPGEWQALRGELVALLDQVEGRYAQAEAAEPVLTGLSRRVRNLRDQVVGPETATRRREALQTVKRAVDRFSERDDLGFLGGDQDPVTSAIAEIRGRQMAGTTAALGMRPSDQPEFRELTSLVGGISGRLERLEVDLKSQRTGGNVREVAAQVEQLTHVVELLAGAVGETGQVKRLEAQIGSLATLIESGPQVDLSAVNNRLDDVSTTVGKLAELQARQMEREIAREDRKTKEPTPPNATVLMPAMNAIEKSVRNVYDRIDSIERNVALSSGDFERLTSEMSSFTQVMKDREAAPSKLVAKVDALAARIGSIETANGDVAGLKQDILALRDTVVTGMEPYFLRLETQIGALSDRIVPTDTSEVERQLKRLMARMDETGAQLDGLAQLYTTQPDAVEIEAMATLVAERTSDAMVRKTPAPVAMFGPEGLKTIEDRLSGLIKAAGRAPDYEVLAAMVAERTSEAVAKSTSSVPSGVVTEDSISALEERMAALFSTAGTQPDYEALATMVAARTSEAVARSVAPATASDITEESMTALEKRMAALFNTAGRDTAERLTRLEIALERRQDPVLAPVSMAAPDAHAETAEEEDRRRFDAVMAALSLPEIRSDEMPASPAKDAPLLDPGFMAPEVASVFDEPLFSSVEEVAAPEPITGARPGFAASSIERPARPQSSFAEPDSDPFAPLVQPVLPPQPEASLSQTSTSTFVAAARRAQRARLEETAPPAATSGSSLISRALGRSRPIAAVPPQGELAPQESAKPLKAGKEKKNKVQAAAAPSASIADGALDAPAARQSFLARHRRPLLLAATLAAVSLLALNLVMQRMTPANDIVPASILAPASADAAPPAPAATQDVSQLGPEARVIDMVDDTATASINPGQRVAMAKPVVTTPMPPTLMASTAGANVEITPLNAPAEIAPDLTGSIPDAGAATDEPFDLPPEGAGPIELRQAAADGDARAQFEIGAIYTEGRAVTQDYAEAAKWYERAAAQGFVPAQYRLGNLYEAGQGVDKDVEVAKIWYQRGAEEGNRMAMHNLAALYAGGLLGDQEFETAAEWFAQAAALGMTDSQFNLGMLYARGLGVEQDFEQSYKWFTLAARSGDADAGKARDDIAKSLSAEAVSRVTAQVAEWQAQPIELEANFAPLGTWSETFDPGQPITTRDVVSKVQAALGKLGFDAGEPDGLSGPQTEEAIKAFERGTGMTESGTINPRLLAVLGSQPV